MAADDKQKFDTKAATQILEDAVKKVLRDATYRADLVPEWQAAIYQETISKLTHTKGPFKYIVTSTILESVGAGVHMTSTSLWDAESDGSAFYRFENKSLIAIVYAFGLAV
ncbi:Dynein light chain Tctex-type 3 [Entomortierella chlamydospora]|uniref:Dynein light chain Tctex-type 3 n=1 Tax=Entomortierella chlamydospora TaxID=101097 RepID=A0A9P6ST98_9FUNG|nr:Dynein light chain Tctex-type 3 [Entomortierella chlamydospora]KAG0004431.1 Dynein light chain Tctex-type 3 [Entomortierella chlamydospora]